MSNITPKGYLDWVAKLSDMDNENFSFCLKADQEFINTLPAGLYKDMVVFGRAMTMSMLREAAEDILFEGSQPKPVSNSSKHRKPDTVGRPGRLNRAEAKYRGNSSGAPKNTHTGKGKTLRNKRP